MNFKQFIYNFNPNVHLIQKLEKYLLNLPFGCNKLSQTGYQQTTQDILNQPEGKK